MYTKLEIPLPHMTLPANTGIYVVGNTRSSARDVSREVSLMILITKKEASERPLKQHL